MDEISHLDNNVDGDDDDCRFWSSCPELRCGMSRKCTREMVFVKGFLLYVPSSDCCSCNRQFLHLQSNQSPERQPPMTGVGDPASQHAMTSLGCEGRFSFARSLLITHPRFTRSLDHRLALACIYIGD